MTFTFKLSRRMSRIRAPLLLLASALFVACGSDISSNSSTDPIPPASGSWAHEPSSFSLIRQNAFDQLLGTGFGMAWNDFGYSHIISDPSGPVSPNGVLEMRYPIGFTGGVGNGNAWHTLSNTRRLFVGFSWKASNPWQGHQSNVNKILFVDPTSGGDIFMAMYGPPGGPYQLRVIPQFPGFDSQWLVPNVGTGVVSLGVWHRIEWLMDMDTGLVQWWMDGKLVGDYRGVPFPTGGFGELKVNPTWGGAGDVKTENDYYRYDHLRISGN